MFWIQPISNLNLQKWFLKTNIWKITNEVSHIKAITLYNELPREDKILDVINYKTNVRLKKVDYFKMCLIENTLKRTPFEWTRICCLEVKNEFRIVQNIKNGTFIDV